MDRRRLACIMDRRRLACIMDRGRLVRSAGLNPAVINAGRMPALNRSDIINIMSKQYRTFAQFWPYYVLEHSRKGTRLLHFIGTSLLFVFLIHALFAQSLVSLAAGVICAYGFAWIGHFTIEKNRPATFQYPLFSLIGDFKMYGLMWTGRMEEEVQRLRLRTT